MPTLNLTALKGTTPRPKISLNLAALSSDFSKAIAHKYISRRKKGKRYVYTYASKGDRKQGTHHVSHEKLTNEDHYTVGSAFAAGGKGKGHYHIKAVDGNKITFQLDEGADGKPGPLTTKSKAEFKDMLLEAHKGANEKHAAEGMEKRLDVLERAKKHGTEKHQKRAQAEVDRWKKNHGHLLEGKEEATTPPAQLPELSGAKRGTVLAAEKYRSRFIKQFEDTLARRQGMKSWETKYKEKFEKYQENLDKLLKEKTSAQWWVDNVAANQFDLLGRKLPTAPPKPPQPKPPTPRIGRAGLGGLLDVVEQVGGDVKKVTAEVKRQYPDTTDAYIKANLPIALREHGYHQEAELPKDKPKAKLSHVLDIAEQVGPDRGKIEAEVKKQFPGTTTAERKKKVSTVLQKLKDDEKQEAESTKKPSTPKPTQQ